MQGTFLRVWGSPRSEGTSRPGLSGTSPGLCCFLTARSVVCEDQLQPRALRTQCPHSLHELHMHQCEGRRGAARGRWEVTGWPVPPPVGAGGSLSGWHVRRNAAQVLPLLGFKGRHLEPVL